MTAAGTRISVLARCAGMTKQAMGQLVRDLEGLGYLTLGPDPSDRRAKLVTYTDSGRRLAADFDASLREVQSEFKKALGKGGLKELRKLLAKLVKTFGE